MFQYQAAEQLARLAEIWLLLSRPSRLNPIPSHSRYSRVIPPVFTPDQRGSPSSPTKLSQLSTVEPHEEKMAIETTEHPERQTHVLKAKLAEKAERHEEMAEAMKEVL